MKDDGPLTPLGRPCVPIQRWARPGTAPSVFTAFVRSQQGEETPDADLLHDAWNGLQAALGGELKRRGLWQSPPCYLGVYGYERWDAEETVGDPMSHAWCRTRPIQSALAELVTDCWAFIFSDRMQSLKLQLMDKENIDGLVLRNVKNFLHERQREHDPVGFRVFERLKGALADAVARQALYVLGGDPRIRNNTVFGFAPAAELRLPAIELEPVVVRWNDELLPALVTARGREEAAVLARLERFLLELPWHGVHCFRLKDLVDPLKSDARQRWAAFLAREDAAGTVECAPEQVQVLRHVLPESAVESRQSFEHLTRCVSASISRIEVDPRTRGYLAALWGYLQHQGTARDEAEESPLSHRQLSQRLQIPRERLPMLFTALKQLVARCRLAGKARLGRRPRE
ncbi:MAG TPA: hypothetical protein VF173_33405 [Thermoanaerobaculia bacterium]|nr:hypothetical protein [Thermoanaerobaculia bacterium]